MGTKVSVKVDIKNIEKKVSPTALARGRLAIANQMLMDMRPFVPFRSGDLRGSGYANKVGVIYTALYARAQFYGSSYNKKRRFTFKRYTTPGTGKRWDLKAKSLHAKDWEKVGMKALGVKK